MRNDMERTRIITGRKDGPILPGEELLLKIIVYVEKAIGSGGSHREPDHGQSRSTASGATIPAENRIRTCPDCQRTTTNNNWCSECEEWIDARIADVIHDPGATPGQDSEVAAYYRRKIDARNDLLDEAVPLLTMMIAYRNLPELQPLIAKIRAIRRTYKPLDPGATINAGTADEAEPLAREFSND